VPRFQVTWTGDAGSGEQTFRPQNLPGEIRVWFDRAGTCSLAVKAKGFEPATASGVAVFADRESSAEVTLRAIPDFPSDAGTAVLILVDADTKSLVSTGHVDLRWRPSGSADPATSSTWSGGPFQSVQFSPPAAGRFEVTLRTAGYETATVVVDVAEDKGSAVEVPLRKRKPD
jgi:hypothetical protein